MNFVRLIPLMTCFSLFPSFPGETWIVFIHGTVGAGYALFHAREIVNNAVKDNSLYARQVARYRANQIATKSKLLLDYGLVAIPPQVGPDFRNQALDPAAYEYGAYMTIGAFDTIMQELQPTTPLRYFTFGWSGLLSQKHRKQAGLELYEALCNARDAQPIPPRIIIVGYSHGGNVPQWLEEAEHAFKRNLTIDALILLACPFQVETVFFLPSPIFKRVYALRSDGDVIPQADRISTSARKSSARLHDFIKPAELNASGTRHVCDIRILVNGNHRAVDHRSFFNLCYNKCIAPAFSGLPILVFMPYILAVVEKHPEWYDMDLHLNYDEQQEAFQITWSEYTSAIIVNISENLYTSLVKVRTLTNQYWLDRISKGADLANMDNMLTIPSTVTPPAYTPAPLPNVILPTGPGNDAILP